MNTLRYFNKKMLVAAIASVVWGLGVTGNASASAYALASFDIKNGKIVGIPAFTASANTTASSATHSAFPPFADLPPPHPTDVRQAYVGAPDGPPLANTFTEWLGTNYGRGDAVIRNADVFGGTGSAASVAQSLLPHGLGSMTASGSGDNKLSGRFTLAIPTAITLSFDYLGHLHAQLTEGGAPIDYALAGLDFEVTISHADDGSIMDQWHPGALNQSISALVAGDSLLRHPGGSESWTSVLIEAGRIHNIDIRMGTRVNTSTSVPEPGTVLLLGGGLMGMAVAARRRTAVKA